jgi:hypothetical protein
VYRSLHTRHPGSSAFSGFLFSSLSDEAQERAINVVRDSQLGDGEYSYGEYSFAEGFDYLVEEFIKDHPYYDLSKEDVELYVDLYGPESKCLFKTTMYHMHFLDFMTSKLKKSAQVQSLFLDPAIPGTDSGNPKPLNIDYVSIEKSKWRMSLDEIIFERFDLELEIEYIGLPESCQDVVVTVSDVLDHSCKSSPDYYKAAGWDYLATRSSFTPFELFLEHLKDAFFLDLEDFSQCNEDIASDAQREAELSPSDLTGAAVVKWNRFDPNYFKVSVVGGPTPLINTLERTYGLSTQDFLAGQLLNTTNEGVRRRVCKDYLEGLFEIIAQFSNDLDDFMDFLGGYNEDGFILEKAKDDAHNLLTRATKQYEDDMSDESITEQIEDRGVMFSLDGSEVLDWG